VSDSLRTHAERAIASVVEAECPLCKVELRLHDERACCPCCGDSYRAGPDRLEVKMCEEHGRTMRDTTRLKLASKRSDWRLGWPNICGTRATRPLSGDGASRFGRPRPRPSAGKGQWLGLWLKRPLEGRQGGEKPCNRHGAERIAPQE
jgi:hypothetical protein